MCLETHQAWQIIRIGTMAASAKITAARMLMINLPDKKKPIEASGEGASTGLTRYA